jgi:erythronate-4-phosphate dehydrogenase
MIKIVADDKIPFLYGALEKYANVVYLPGREIVREKVIDADALLIRTRTRCTESLLAGTKVRFIGTATIGFDHIDTAYCKNHQIEWTNAPGCNSLSVQQYIASALLKIASDFSIKLEGKTIGIVGVGNVGSRVEKLARTLGMNILLNDPPRAREEGGSDFVRLSYLLHHSDFVTVHVPFNIVGEDNTYHLFNEDMFGKMKKGSWFLNSSRGEVTETAALKSVLVSGKLGGAVIDVWENEPDIDLELMTNAFIATPHIAGYSTDGKANGTAMSVNSLCKFFNIPLSDWYPDNIPQPAYPVMKIISNGKTKEDLIREAVLNTYDISVDDMKLRSSPHDFEKLRGDYPLRREFASYSLSVNGNTKRVRKVLEKLGFKIE